MAVEWPVWSWGGAGVELGWSWGGAGVERHPPMSGSLMSQEEEATLELKERQLGAVGFEEQAEALHELVQSGKVSA